MTDPIFVHLGRGLAGDVVAGGPLAGGRPRPPPITCGENRGTFPIEGSSAGHATRDGAVRGALDELVWPMFDAVDRAYDTLLLQKCPTACPKRERPKPQLVPVRHRLEQDAQGTWTCSLALQLVVVVRCKNDVEHAATPPPAPLTDVEPLADENLAPEEAP